MRKLFPILMAFVVLIPSALAAKKAEPIDRLTLVKRHTVHVSSFDSLASLSVGNGNFAFTVDATGLQSFPERYKDGVPLGTQSQWGWHSFPNVEGYKSTETLKNFNFRGKEEPYSVQFTEAGRSHEAAEYFRINPHRLHLGIVGLEMFTPTGIRMEQENLTRIFQSLDLWNGLISSSFKAGENTVEVETSCHPSRDRIAAVVRSSLFKTERMFVKFDFPYPTGKHSDDACDWNSPEKHQTEIFNQDVRSVILKRTIDSDTYFVRIRWSGNARFTEKSPHRFRLTTLDGELRFTCEFLPKLPEFCMSDTENAPDCCLEDQTATKKYWNEFWKGGGSVDFSACTDPRAFELERRVVLSQYLMAIQCAGMYPPQESGLTYNTWYGKFHIEMHWWHAAQFALWNRSDLLERSMDWYKQVEPMAASIAKRQGFNGVRWMKMTDPSGTEAPSKVGSMLIWQQPEYIYLAELLYRNCPDTATLNAYKDLVFKTADFMASFADYDGMEDRYVLKGIIPAQETLKASETVNPPFELQYWYFGLKIAQQWRLRSGLPKNMKWEIILDKLSPLAHQNNLYLAAETATDTYKDTRFTSDHMAVLGAMGVLPVSRLVRPDIMTNTFLWIWDNWNWGKTWGWDYPMTAMSAARLGLAEKAVDALLMDKRTNTYLVNGHNYQDERLRIYLPGNGGLLTAVAMMCAGWDGSKGNNPGFPKNGKWKVRWEGLKPMP
jgi:hypothetical protein